MSLDRLSADAAERCFYCPKMCRFSCPVSHEFPRETLTPWGKMTQLRMTSEAGSAAGSAERDAAGPLETLAQKARKLLDRKPAKSLDPDTAESFYACTGCLRCRTWCEHENDVPRALYQGRAEAVAQGVAPAAATAVADRFARLGHAQQENPLPVVERIAASRRVPAGGTSVLFAGCEAPLSRPAVVEAALDASRALGVPLPLAAEPACCGRPLFEAGCRDAFRDHVAGVWARFGEREVVTLSAACARALSEWSREVGVTPRGPVVHATTFLARRLGPEIQAKRLPGNALYHDPCHLGRGLGEYDAPRRLLQAALEGGVKEAADSRERSDCCGATGLLPRTYPNTAKAMSMSRADALREVEASRVVTACPSCQHSLQAAGLDVVDVVELTAEWLTAKGPSTQKAASAASKHDGDTGTGESA